MKAYRQPENCKSCGQDSWRKGAPRRAISAVVRFRPDCNAITVDLLHAVGDTNSEDQEGTSIE